ncbi:MAG: hypothetical protein ACFFCW_02125 [Candidatus Hodarchaeota archaeon]
MSAERQKAAALTVAPKNAQQTKSYQCCARKSSGNLKGQIGELLLYLQTTLSQKEQTRGWQVFEQSLRYYVSVKKLGELV